MVRILQIETTDKVVYNFSSVTLSDSNKSLLSEAFSSPTTSLEYSEYLVNHEHFFGDMLNLETSHLDCELLMSRLKNLAFSSFKTCNSSRKRNNLTPE